MTRTTTLDLHGLVRIRLEDATAADAAVIARQLGPLPEVSDTTPDLTIRFVDRLDTRGRVRYLGHEDAGFTDDAYLVLRGRHKSSVRVQVPITRIGTGPSEIVCERGVTAVPLLVPMIALTALSRDVLPVHGSAFVHDDRGVLVVGWAKGGKSETLLAFATAGASYVGDEWIFIDVPTQRMYGLPEPMRIWDWQLRSLPGLAQAVSPGARRRLAVTRSSISGLRGVERIPIMGRKAPGKVARRVRAILEQQQSVQVPTEQLLGAGPLDDGWSLDRLILVVSHDAPMIDVQPIDARTVAARATASLLFEFGDLLGHYRRARFAFPESVNPALEGLEATVSAAMDQALGGQSALMVAHPYPVEIASLRTAIAPHLTTPGGPSVISEAVTGGG